MNTKELYLLYCDEYGSEERTYDSVQKKVKVLREAYSEIDDDVETEKVLEFFKVGEQPFVNTVKPGLARKRVKHAGTWLEELIGQAEVKPKVKVKKLDRGKDKSSLVVMLSDTHFGKFTGVYDLDVARERMLSVPHMLYSKRNEFPELDEIVILLGGDMVEGEDIYPTQNTHVECSTIEQVQACVDAIWEMMLTFRDLFRLPVVVETVPGNHGRMSKTANEKTNWDNVVYYILEFAARTHSGIDVNCNFDKFKVFNIKDQKGLLYHKGVKHTGTPAMREKVAGWAHGKDFNFLVHGHWHEWHVGNWLGRFVISNGCMCGPDDLAEEMAKEDTARQAYFFVTPKRPAWGFSFLEWED